MSAATATDRRSSAARSRALTRLANLHPGQYRILMDQEMDR